ncbi:MAG: ABC transporter substrate-binding protein [Deltaproteobacteria bacterium]|nr:ABC transporter substrate-binding protein [Deltaproteobacteria bacterium]
MWVRGSSRLLGLLLFAASCAAGEGCTLLVDSSAEQCSTNGDCTSKGGAFAGSVCGPEHTCVIRCTTNKACMAQRGGQPAICVGATGACAPLLSPDCKTIFQEDSTVLENDRAVVLGVLLPQTGENAASMKPRVNAIELARRHIHTAAGGLPSGDGASRPLVILSCTDADDPVRAARHLAEVVHVPAIIGPAFSGVTTTVARDVTIPRGVLVISPSATSPTITHLDDKGLVWRTAPSDVIQAAAMVQLVATRLEPEVRTALALKETDKIKLALVHKGDAYGVGLAAALFRDLRFNGGATAAANDPAYYKELGYVDPLKTTPAEQAASYKKTVDDLVAFAPHVLITIGTAEAVNEVFAKAEASWPAAASYRPRHLVADGLQVPELIEKIGTNDGLRKRVLGTIAGVPGANYDSFANDYKVVFGTDTQPDSYAAGAYDATLLVAYAIAAAGNQPLTGALVDAGLKKSVPGPRAVPINAGHNDINAGFSAMGKDGIDYNGASGPLDFDVTTGEAPADIQIWCVRSSGGKATAFVSSGLIFAAKSKALEGTFSCP